MSTRRSKRLADAVVTTSVVEKEATKKAKTNGAATAAAAQVGQLAPDFELETDEGEKVRLSSLTKDGGMVLFFYPKANTPGCTKQACGFRDNFDKLKEKGYTVYGISADKPSAQASWRAKEKLQFRLLCDPTRAAIKAFGVLKGTSGIVRSHVIIDKGGIVREMQVQVSPADSVAKAVATVMAT